MHWVEQGNLTMTLTRLMGGIHLYSLIYAWAPVLFIALCLKNMFIPKYALGSSCG